VTKPELGTKRLCAGCNAKFYDLMKDPIVCPMCETVFVPPKPAPARPSRRAQEPVIAPVPVAVKPAEDAEIEGSEIETVELDDEASDDKADGEKDAEAGVPMLEVDED
jgi:uncharacterized protein (TIGR02300 family)